MKAIVAEGPQPALNRSTMYVKELLNFGDQVGEILARSPSFHLANLSSNNEL